MHNCLTRHPFRYAALVAAVTLLVMAMAVPAYAQLTSASRIAADPEVQAAQRLFSAWLDGQLLERGLPGVAVGVVADQELVWAAGFGVADTQARTPMTPATRFRMASHSKLFTATAIMQLREDGKLRLDDPVALHLPWFTVKRAEADDPPITIEELLTHSSGLPRRGRRSLDHVRVPDRRATARADVRPPSTVSAGNPLEILEPRLFHCRTGRRAAKRTAVGYGRRRPDGTRDVNPFIDARGMAAATGLTFTVEDMARFVSAQMRRGPRGGAQILSSGSLREMHRVRVLETNWTQGNAIGFAVRKAGDKIYVTHGGSYPGYQTNTMLWLDGKVGVIVLTNADDGNPGSIATELMNTIGQAVAKAAARPAPVVAWDSSWTRFAGLYRGRGGDSQVVLLHERLVIINPAAANLDNPIRLEPIGNGQFRYLAPTGGGPVGEIVRFVEENGRVVRMYLGDGFVERVTP